MQIYLVKNYEDLSQKAYKIIKEVIEVNEKPVISLNTGGTPRNLFKKLVDGINNGLDISKTALFTLDEYVGASNAMYSVQTYMRNNLINLISSQFSTINLIQGDAEDKVKEISRYKTLLKHNPRDIQLLGLGTNGHIGANEPGTPFNSTMFVAQHRESTILSTMKTYNISKEETPTEMFTLGFTEILEAKKILLLISGNHKAQTTKDFLEGPITETCPVTCLRNHQNVTVIIDKEATRLLSEKTKQQLIEC